MFPLLGVQLNTEHFDIQLIASVGDQFLQGRDTYLG